MTDAIPRPKIAVEILRADHDISSFISSSKDLTEYFHEEALEDTMNKTAITHVLLNEERQIVGYFTLLNDRIKYRDIESPGLLVGYNYQYIPSLKIGRMSTHTNHEREGLGTMMILLAFNYLFHIIRYSGCRVVTVDSKKGCEGFYGKHGFCSTRARKYDFTSMYLDIGSFKIE